MSASLVGRNLGRYRVISELGRGQHSTVYMARQLSLDRPVALKVLHRRGQGALAKFQAEARLTAQLVQQNVPHIRQIYEVGQTPDGYVFVVLEFVEDSLRSILKRSRQIGRRMSPTAAARLLLPVAQALDAIHRLGWVHLDIKPQNILISQDGRTMLADFGIAQRVGTKTHACTPTYASPEQAAGDRPVGPWSDIYSLGAVLYEMVAGHPPVRGDQDVVLLNQHLEAMPPSPRKVNAQLTAGQERAIYRALAKAPKDRFAMASELIEAMLSTDTFFASIVQTPSALRRTTSSWFRRLPKAVLIAGILLLLAVVVVVGWALWPQGSVVPPGSTATATAGVSAATATPLATAAVHPLETPTSAIAPTVTLAPRPGATGLPESTPSSSLGP